MLINICDVKKMLGGEASRMIWILHRTNYSVV